MARGIAWAVSFGGRATARCCSYRRITVAVCLPNLVAALVVLRSLTSFAPTPKRGEVVQYTEEQIRRVEESIRFRRDAELVQAVKKLRKVFAREEKRRKELPLELKQKVSYEIVRRLRDLGDNSSVAQQRESKHGGCKAAVGPQALISSSSAMLLKHTYNGLTASRCKGGSWNKAVRLPGFRARVAIKLPNAAPGKDGIVPADSNKDGVSLGMVKLPANVDIARFESSRPCSFSDSGRTASAKAPTCHFQCR